MKTMRIHLLSGAVTLVLLGTQAHAATSFVSPLQPFACAAHNWANSLAAATGATACTQPAVGDLANVAAGTVLGNATGSTAAPTATSAPVLGVASTTNGTLGLYSSGTANAITVQNVGATAAYNFNLPNTVGTSGQALLSGAGTTNPMTWGNVVTAALVVSTKTQAASPYAVTAADDWKRFDNAGSSGSVNFTLPSAPSAGDNWCFLVAAAQTLTITANTGESITLGNVTGATAGTLSNNTVGSSVCLYFQSSTAAYVWTFNGNWSLS